MHTLCYKRQPRSNFDSDVQSRLWASTPVLAMQTAVIATGCLSVCLSVCPPVRHGVFTTMRCTNPRLSYLYLVRLSLRQLQ